MELQFCFWILLTLTSYVSEICSQRNEDIQTTTASPSYTLQRIKSQRLSMLRSYVLESLGFASPPQITANLSRQEALARVLTQYQNRKIEESRCYLPSCSLPNRINQTLWTESNNYEQNMYFDIISNEETVVNATLKLRVLPNTDIQRTEPTRLAVMLYQYTKPLRRRRRSRTRMNRLISANAVTWSRFSSWATFDATEAVRDWATDDRKNNGLKIKIQESFGVNIGSLFSQPDCTAHVDVDCRVSETPFRFRRSHNAILEVVTERAMFG